MFFLWQRNCKQHLGKQFLTYFRCEWIKFASNSVKLPLVQLKNTIKKAVRRMSLLPLPFDIVSKKKVMKLKAGISVEAALVMPLFMFFVLNLFSVIEMLRFHGNVAWALNTVGGKLSIYGYVQDSLGDEWNTGVFGDAIFSYLYIKEEIMKTLGEEYVQTAPVSGGKEGIWITEAKILEDECIELTLVYKMKLPFGAGGFGDICVYNCYKTRAWTGYDVSLGEEVVYVTESGETYHVKTDCRSLNIVKRQVHFSDLETLRNETREKYTACNNCYVYATDYVWITKEGNKYHGRKDCPSLKRTITKMYKSQAQTAGYEMCNWCGSDCE